MQIKTFSTEEEFISETLAFIAHAHPKTIALSGGSTPLPLYKRMKIQAQLYQVDERYVPSDHPDSNYKMITDAGLNLEHYFDTSLPIEECLTKYEKELPEQFDLTILGIGPDGHIASIFPNTKLPEKNVAHSKTTNFAIEDRLTLTFTPILNSKKILILLKNKPEILKKLQEPSSLNVDNFPASRILPHPNLTIHYLQS